MVSNSLAQCSDRAGKAGGGCAPALECGVAILDINLAPGLPGGFDAYRWLKQRGFSGRTVFLSGHDESHPLVAQISRLPDVQVIRKPVTFDVLMALLKGEDPATPARTSTSRRGS